MLEVVTHPVGGVSVEAAHAGDLVAKALFGEDLGDAVFGHPGLVAVSEAMQGQAGLDREPAGERRAVGNGVDAAAAGWHVGGQVRAGGAGGRLGGWPGGDRDAGPDGGVDDDELGWSAGCCFVASVAGGAEHAAGVVAASVVAAVRAEEHVPAAAAMLGGTSTRWMGVGLDVAGDQVGEERREVDGQAGLPVRAPVGVIFRRQTVELAVEFAELPFDVDLGRVSVGVFQADRLAPPQAGVADGEDHGEVLVPARQQCGALGEE